MEIKEEIVIVGAGIAGVATALALKKVGIRSLVLERSDALRTTGAALTLSYNAWVALDALGVSDKLKTIYSPLEKASVTNVSNGTVQEIVFPDKNRNMMAPIPVHRSTLLETMAQELPDDYIRFSSKLRSIETLKQEGSTITALSLEDGTILKAKVVIGCDGVHSEVGRWLGLKDPIYSGRFAVRGLAVYPQGHGLGKEGQQFIDGHTRAGIISLNDKEIYWFSLYSKDEKMTKEDPGSIQRSVLEIMANFPPIFLDVVQHSDLSTLSWAPLMLRAPWDVLLHKMYKDNVTTAGDAMHPMTPDLAQGGCSSLEDAVVLGRHIGNSYVRNGTIDPRALEGYVKERRWRVALLISGSYLSGWIQQGGSGWFMKFLRNKVFYKFFPLLTLNIVRYNCGKLPTIEITAEESITKKTE
ncbi:hypothetical protein ACHQM5_012395 [Ranunculus cassubicifolius]